MKLTSMHSIYSNAWNFASCIKFCSMHKNLPSPYQTQHHFHFIQKPEIFKELFRRNKRRVFNFFQSYTYNIFYFMLNKLIIFFISDFEFSLSCVLCVWVFFLFILILFIFFTFGFGLSLFYFLLNHFFFISFHLIFIYLSLK